MKFLLIYVPNLRFNGYTENWQKYRTIELGQMQRGKSKHRPRDDEKLYGGAYPFIQTGDIKKANLYIKEYERTYSNYGLSQSKLWPKGTLCITIAANIAETAILGLNACFPDSVIGWISNEKITNNIFIKYYFDFYKTQLKRLSVGGAQENLNLDKLENVYFHIPTLPEQNDITNLLTKIDELIETQIKIIDTLLSEINSIRSLIFNKSSLKWIPLKDIVAEQDIKLKRGKVIPKHKKNLKYIYPVYSSSITNLGLMGYSDSYMFNQELITWSIDGGGNFFYRKKHKFNITNVSGYMILNENLFNYQFIVQSLIWQHEKLKFDYQTKAHPSVVESLYKIPIMDLEEQHKYACLFSNLNEKYELELHILDLLNMQKKYLLKNMFV